MNATRTLAASVALLAAFGLADGARAQAPGKDDALEKLLKELDDPKAKDAGLSGKPAGEPKPEAAKDADKKKPEELAPKDQELDDLLGKLGATEETPAPDEPRKPGPPPPDQKSESSTGPEKAGEKDQLRGEDQALDEALRERSGKRSRKKDDQQDGEGQGPLGDVIRQMREVEKRLGEPDTGEETRRRQTQIVQKLDGLIDQMRESQGQSKSLRRTRQKPQGGQQKPGQQQGQQPGALAGGAPNQRPETPKGKPPAMGDKDAWGHLDSILREEMANVFKEVALPSREELVKRYYLAVSKKSLSRED